MNYLLKITKKFILFILMIVFPIQSYAAVSVSDGSAFVSKSEFASTINNISNRMSIMENTLDAKIDSLVSSYLSRNGIWNGDKQEFKNVSSWNGSTGMFFYPSDSWIITTNTTLRSLVINNDGTVSLKQAVRTVDDNWDMFRANHPNLWASELSSSVSNYRPYFYSTKSGLCHITFSTFCCYGNSSFNELFWATDYNGLQQYGKVLQLGLQKEWWLREYESIGGTNTSNLNISAVLADMSLSYPQYIKTSQTGKAGGENGYIRADQSASGVEYISNYIFVSKGKYYYIDLKCGTWDRNDRLLLFRRSHDPNDPYIYILNTEPTATIY